MTEADLVAQWMPAGRRAAKYVASRYGATDQERRDILELVPATLWELVNAGIVAADSPPRFVIVAVGRSLVGGRRGVSGYRHWRPNAVKAVGDRGQRYLKMRPISTFAESDGAEVIAQSIAGRTVYHDHTDETMMAVARAAGLSEMEADAVRENMGNPHRKLYRSGGRDTARGHRMRAVVRARKKCMASEKAMELLT